MADGTEWQLNGCLKQPICCATVANQQLSITMPQMNFTDSGTTAVISKAVGYFRNGYEFVVSVYQVTVRDGPKLR